MAGSECYSCRVEIRRLGHVEPRERAGAQTGRKYEYQYERTARAAFDLLADDTEYARAFTATGTTIMSSKSGSRRHVTSFIR